MKKITAVLSIILILASVGCTPKTTGSSSTPPPEQSSQVASQVVIDQSTPSGTLNLFMQSLSVWNLVEAKTYISDPNDFDDYRNEIPSQIEKEVEKAFVKFLSSMTYSSGKEVISASGATVELTVTTTDVSQILSGFITELVKQATATTLQGKPFDYEKYLLDNLPAQFEKTDLPQATRTVTVYLVKGIDGKWLIDNDEDRNYNYANALTGGLLETLKQLEPYLPDRD